MISVVPFRVAHNTVLIRIIVLVFALFCFELPAQIAPVPATVSEPQAPPEPPPVQTRAPEPTSTRRPLTGGTTLYSIGQPSDEEQLYLEYINRSRANPTAEGARLASTTDPDVVAAYSAFGVNLSLMQSEFSTNPFVPPLAMNAQLVAAARLHSGDMF